MYVRMLQSENHCKRLQSFDGSVSDNCVSDRYLLLSPHPCQGGNVTTSEK
jgi:hypothetical protein